MHNIFAIFMELIMYESLYFLNQQAAAREKEK